MNARPKLHIPGFLRESIDTIIFVVAVFVLVEMALPRFLVEGRSMQPTFVDNQRLVISRLNYMFGEPQRGDVVVFNAPGQSREDAPLIKRLIALPGETVEIRDTLIYINGEQIEETYINEPCRPVMCRNNVWVLEENEYFLMGDNRNHSNDSRAFGPVGYEYLIGEAVVRYWPLPDAKLGFQDSWAD